MERKSYEEVMDEVAREYARETGWSSPMIAVPLTDDRTPLNGGGYFCMVKNHICNKSCDVCPDNLPSMQQQEKDPPYRDASSICSEAHMLMQGRAERRHGDKLENTENVASLWTAYLGHVVTAQDVALMMALLKIARTKTGRHNIDDYVDIAGWGACAGEIASRENPLTFPELSA